jgi:SAM-dependent methyltransferase
MNGINLNHGISAQRLIHYLSAEGSRYHHDKYRRWNKRVAHHVECAILHGLLRHVGHSHDVLDAPSGPGRFFNVIKEHADEVHLGDISTRMLDIAREQTQNRAASYTVLDLLNVGPAERTFEGVISLRLTHHIYEAEVVEEYFRGLALLTRRWLIVTFPDARAPRTLWRRMGHRLRGKRHLPAQTIDHVSEAMKLHGFHFVASAQVSPWFSGHCYALFVRNTDKNRDEYAGSKIA